MAKIKVIGSDQRKSLEIRKAKQDARINRQDKSVEYTTEADIKKDFEKRLKGLVDVEVIKVLIELKTESWMNSRD